MIICYKCLAEVEETVMFCPNCGVLLVSEVEKTNPDFPFGTRINENEPAMLCANLRAGDVIIYNWDEEGEECLHFFSRKAKNLAF